MRPFVRILLLLGGALAATVPARAAGISDCVPLVAARLDGVFAPLAASTRALAHEVAALSSTARPPTPAVAARWRQATVREGKVVGFRTWAGALDAPPAYQAPHPAYYTYDGPHVSQANLARLGLFRRLVPLFRATHNTFGHAWTYLTTADDMMLLYPYLPLGQAVNNQPPTRQVFYTVAAEGRTGWTPPYLDLAGAGMMVTVSSPVKKGGNLLGVVSHDVTLADLSGTVLAPLVADSGRVAWLVDDNGRAVAVSDPALARELEDVNTKAKAAVLHYEAGDTPARVTSATAWINTATTTVRAALARAQSEAVVTVTAAERTVTATRLKTLPWVVLLAEAPDD